MHAGVAAFLYVAHPAAVLTRVHFVIGTNKGNSQGPFRLRLTGS